MKKSTVEKKVQEIKESFADKPTPETAIQNNYYHFNIQVQPKEIEALAKQNSELAKKYLQLQEKQLDHAIETDKEILQLEKNEQKIRHDEIPHIRTYTFRGQFFAFLAIGASFISAIAFGLLGMEKAAIASIVVGAGTVAIQFLGAKTKTKK